MAKLDINDIAQALSLESGIPKAAAKAYTAFIFRQIRTYVENGDAVHIRNFGNFEMHVTPERAGRNLYTKESVRIPAKNRIKFTMSRQLGIAYDNHDNKKAPDDGGMERSQQC